MIRQLIPFIVLAIATPYILSQARKPSRWVGRFFVWFMNQSHSELTDWGLGHVHVGKDFSILDVGCGGGRTIEKLAAVADEGKVFGVDYAAGSVDASRARNIRLIEADRVDVREASVSQLPFPPAAFDLVTAVETLYYWPDPTRDMREVFRVLKAGGTLVVIAESYSRGKYDVVQRWTMRSLGGVCLSADEHRTLLASAGFVDVEVFEDRGHGWICVTGRKLPLAA